MIIKIVGMVSMFSFCIIFSRSITKKMKDRVKELEEINRTLNDFIVSINTGLYEVPFLIEESIKITNTKYNSFLKSVLKEINIKKKSDFSRIWADEVKKTHLTLEDRDLVIFLNIGVGLSFNDKNRMIKQLTLTKSEIEESIRLAKEDRDKKVALYEKMGILAGSFFVIMFI